MLQCNGAVVFLRGNILADENRSRVAEHGSFFGVAEREVPVDRIKVDPTAHFLNVGIQSAADLLRILSAYLPGESLNSVAKLVGGVEKHLACR